MNAKPDAIIRAANLADIPILLRMMEELAKYHGDISGISAKILERDAFGSDPWVTVLVADQKEVIIGYVVFYRLYRQKKGERGILIEHLFVDSSVRGKGIGRRLVDATLTEARQLECTFCTVETHPDNVKAQSFYRALGFGQAGTGGPKFKLSMGP